MLRGHSVESTADGLDLAPGTVEIHRRNIDAKLELSSQSRLFSRVFHFPPPERRVHRAGEDCPAPAFGLAFAGRPPAKKRTVYGYLQRRADTDGAVATGCEGGARRARGAIT